MLEREAGLFGMLLAAIRLTTDAIRRLFGFVAANVGGWGQVNS